MSITIFCLAPHFKDITHIAYQFFNTHDLLFGRLFKIIGRNMEEVESKTFSFKNPSKDHPSDIHVKFNLHEGYGWEPWRENGEQLDNFENASF